MRQRERGRERGGGSTKMLMAESRVACTPVYSTAAGMVSRKREREREKERERDTESERERERQRESE